MNDSWSLLSFHNWHSIKSWLCIIITIASHYWGKLIILLFENKKHYREEEEEEEKAEAVF